MLDLKPEQKSRHWYEGRERRFDVPKVFQNIMPPPYYGEENYNDAGNRNN